MYIVYSWFMQKFFILQANIFFLENELTLLRFCSSPPSSPLPPLASPPPATSAMPQLKDSWYNSTLLYYISQVISSGWATNSPGTISFYTKVSTWHETSFSGAVDLCRVDRGADRDPHLPSLPSGCRCRCLRGGLSLLLSSHLQPNQLEFAISSY